MGMGSPPPRRSSVPAGRRSRALPFAVPALPGSAARPLACPLAALARAGPDETCAGEEETGAGGRGCAHAPRPEAEGRDEAPCWGCVLLGAQAAAGWQKRGARDAEEADGTLGRTLGRAPEAGVDPPARRASLWAAPSTDACKSGVGDDAANTPFSGQDAVFDDAVVMLTRVQGAKRALEMELENLLDRTLTAMQAQDLDEIGSAPSFPDLRAFWGAGWIYRLGAGVCSLKEWKHDSLR
ncbi:hypothetical protein DFJ74DRAFT_701162 [Hyaloraphidium curvatum]|nr:hypothetical protein DFJ74DRAFT_701162 [Hyaloraphidium curvatum]